MDHLPFHFFEFKCAVVVKGVPYWIVYPEEEDEFNVGEIFLWFDVGNEVFRQLPVPCIYLMSSCQCQGFFVLVYSSAVHALLPLTGFEDPNEFVDMWVMEDSGVGGRDCSWSKKFTVGPILGVERLLGCSKNGEKKDSRSRFHLMELKTWFGSIGSKEVKNVQINGALAGSSLVCSYSESLVSIRGFVQVWKLDKKFSEQFYKQDIKNRYRGHFTS